MSEIVPIVPAKSGNTKQISAAKKWCMTLNNYTEEDINNIKKEITKHSPVFIIEKETGENGTPHLQGYIEFKTRIRPLSLKWNNKIHWEKANGTREQNFTYCSKENNIILDSRNISYDHIKLPDKLYKWQEKLIEDIKKEPDNRTIIWLYEKEGNCGKTTMAKYLCIKYKALYVQGKRNDILYAAAETDCNIYIIDLPRTTEDRVPYEAIENLKNGIFFSGKYESKQIIRNCPHVIIFANFKPDTTKLSIDRWKIKEIINNIIQ